MKIGFIGVGNMGGPMAVNLSLSGYEVTGFNRARPLPRGIRTGLTLADTVADASVVITMLPDGDVLQGVVQDVIDFLPSNALFVDCSTTDIPSAQIVDHQLKSKGMRFLDAPVSGGTAGAKKGALTFMVGGAEDDFAAVFPVLNEMGARAIHCGPIGSGQAAKICNQMIAATTMISTCESFVLARTLGLDPQKLFEVVSTSSGNSWAMSSYCPWPGVGPETPADYNYAPGFATELMLKDVSLALKAGWQRGQHLDITEKSAELFADFVEEGGGAGRDFSAIIEFIQAKG